MPPRTNDLRISFPNDWEDVETLDGWQLIGLARSIHEAEELCGQAAEAGDFMVMPPRLLRGVESWAVYRCV